jgi:sugar phosphate isomerase/epimerase
MKGQESFLERIGVDYGKSMVAEEAVVHASRNGLRYIDIQIDVAPNALETFGEARCENLRQLCVEKRVKLGLHTLSAVNIAEISLFLREAVDCYLRAYIDAAARLSAGWIVVHGGYHFTADRKVRVQASLDRLKRATEYAESRNVTLLLENLNGEPERAEVHYIVADDLEECQRFFDEIRSPNLGWSFTVNHASFAPAGIEGFVRSLPMERCGEVRLADNNGKYEIHMPPGEGIIDFPATFKMIEGRGFTGHYMNAWGKVRDGIAGRQYMVEAARLAGVDVTASGQ